MRAGGQARQEDADEPHVVVLREPRDHVELVGPAEHLLMLSRPTRGPSQSVSHTFNHSTFHSGLSLDRLLFSLAYLRGAHGDEADLRHQVCVGHHDAVGLVELNP